MDPYFFGADYAFPGAIGQAPLAPRPKNARMAPVKPSSIALGTAAALLLGLAAARALRAGGADDSAGSREAALLARARRAELYLPLLP